MTPAASRAYRLLADEDAATGVRRAIVARLEKAAERLREPLDGDALAEAIHGARKDLKKARAALRLVREEVGEETFKRENHALRDAARMLSASRDAEVKLETLQGLAERFGDELPAAATVTWREALEEDRQRLAAGGSEGLAEKVEQAIATIEAGRARIPDWPLKANSWELLEPGLTRTYRDGRRALARAQADGGGGESFFGVTGRALRPGPESHENVRHLISLPCLGMPRRRWPWP